MMNPISTVLRQKCHIILKKTHYHRGKPMQLGLFFFLWISTLLFTSLWAQQVNGYAKVDGISAQTLFVSSVDETFDTFEDGETILIIQTQDDVIGTNTNNDVNFGDLADIQSAGLFEFVTIATHTETGGLPQSITLSSPLLNNYNTGPNSTLQIVTFPNLGNNYTTTANITAQAWDGDKGGIVAFEVGTLNLAHNIDVSVQGFRGAMPNSGSSSFCQPSVYITTTGAIIADKGEGIYKDTDPNFAAGRAKILTGGGGGSSHNGGGGGGGNFTAGGPSGPGWSCGTQHAGGHGGIGLTNQYTNTPTKLFFGGGAGAGEDNNLQSGTPGNGGGIIYVKAESIITPNGCTGGQILADGGHSTNHGNDGQAGGGAGGTIVLDVRNWTINAVCPMTISASGGNGGHVLSGAKHGGGGGGGLGALYFAYDPPPTNTIIRNEPGAGGLNCATSSCDSAESGVDGNGLFTNYKQGPAAIPGAALWVKANQTNSLTLIGNEVNSWADVSGNTSITTQASTAPSNLITLQQNVVNFNPSVQFMEGHTGLLGHAPANNWDGELTAYIIALNTSHNNHVHPYYTVFSSDRKEFYSNSNLGYHLDSNGMVPAVTPAAATTEPSVVSLTYIGGNSTGAALNGSGGFTNNANLITTTLGNNIMAASGDFGIGKYTAGNVFQERNFIGDILEIIVYPQNHLNQNDSRLSISSYLALKYGITLDQTNAQNYVSSNENVFMWNATQAGNYNHDIFGIGRDDNSELHQKISKSVNSCTILTASTSTDFTNPNQEASRTNVGTPGTDDLVFATFANNGDDISFQTNELPASRPPHYNVRIGREWQVQKTNFSQEIHLQFDGFDTQWSVFVSNNPNFSTTHYTAPLDANGRVNISHANLPDGAYITLAGFSASLDGSETHDLQICGSDLLLQAETGYTNYEWFQDQNGNNQIDGSDSPLNDGDPDNDASTMTVTNAGTYMVRKSNGAGCATFLEIFNVTPFDNTTDLIVDYLRALNADSDPNNDYSGEIVQCSVDGSELARIFLCGSADTQLLDLTVSGTATVHWEKLDESSCGAASLNCPNTNSACTWNQVAAGSSYTANDPGKFRVVITDANGCSSRSYFDVFRNELNFGHDSQDMLCGNDGYINITGIGSGYGYQLVNAVSQAILVPYSAQNGPNFTIGTAGTYKVQITQLNPLDNTPITDACIFETPNIQIEERPMDMQVQGNIDTCDGNSSIEVTINNLNPNYTFELYTDNGSGSAGTLIDTETASVSNNYTFDNLNFGNYVIVGKTEDGCEETQTYSLVSTVVPISVSAVVNKNIDCSDAQITLTGLGGDLSTFPQIRYAIWSINGTDVYPGGVTNVPSADWQTNPVFNVARGDEGNYTFVAVDSNLCYAISNPVTITDLGDLSHAISLDTPASCGGGSGVISLTANGGTAPYQYSIDGGTTFQNSPTFTNLTSGTYDVLVIDSGTCASGESFEIPGGKNFTANATVIQDATCRADGQSIVRFTNVNGGTAPYSFSYDGGLNFTTDTERLMPPGNYVMVAQDAAGCELQINVTTPVLPTVPNITPTITYNCDGTGNVSFSNDQPTYEYRYARNGMENSPDPADPNFSNVPVGNHTFTASYRLNDLDYSVLLLDTFGTGPNIESPETLGYTFEDQVGPGAHINDYEYSVTSYIEYPFGQWLRPTDHTANDPNGRYLVINIGSPQPGQVIYKKSISDILPNQPLEISLAAINLLQSGSTGLRPDLVVQARIPNTTTVVGEVRTNNIPKDDVWHTYSFTLDPGVNTSLDFVIISEKIGNFGNDVAIDDIMVRQLPQSCWQDIDFPITIEAGRGFDAQLVSVTDAGCDNGGGSVTFTVANFDSVNGFEYSFDNGTTWNGPHTTSPFTTPATLSAGAYNLIIRNMGSADCDVLLNPTVNQTPSLQVAAQINREVSCTDKGILEAIPLAPATDFGGTPPYEYSLQDDLGTTLVAFPNPTGPIFNNLDPGTYRILIRDARYVPGNSCEAQSALITLNPTDPVTFDAVPSACYSGANDGSITITVNSGNGGYQYRLNTGPWITPSPAAASYTFTNLANDTYVVSVRDASGCEDSDTNVVVPTQLVVDTQLTHPTYCDGVQTDGNITINASGGKGAYTYAVVNDGISPSPTDFSPTNNVVSITNALAGTYDVYVRDDNGNTNHCEVIVQDLVISAAVEWEMAYTVNAPNCNGETGSIEIQLQNTSAITLSPAEIAQIGPFEYEVSFAGGAVIETVSNISALTQLFANLNGGTNYDIRVSNSIGCTLTETNINMPDPVALSANLHTILPSSCGMATGFEFQAVTAPAGSTLEYSIDAGTTWQTDEEFFTVTSGNAIFPSIRTVDGSSNTLCRLDFPRYTLEFPLDDLDISISTLVVNCNDLQVTVLGTAGNPNYTYTYSEDPTNFDPNTATWTPAQAAGVPYTFTNLIPGKTYVFYVRDGQDLTAGVDPGCTRQSNVNVSQLIIDNNQMPILITPTITDSCDGLANGEISYSIAPDVAEPQMRWEFYQVGVATPLQVSTGPGQTATTGGRTAFVNTLNFTGLATEDYFLQVTMIDGSDTETCISASENNFVNELPEMTANASVLRNISCNQPGLIQMSNLNGGNGSYTFTITGPPTFTTISNIVQNPIAIPAGSPAGTYTIQVNDTSGNNCSVVTAPTVSMTLTPSPTITSVTAANCSGTIEITAVGNSATGPLRYALVPDAAPIPTSFEANGGIFSNVSPGDWDVYVIDGNGCISPAASILAYPVLSAQTTLTQQLSCGVGPTYTSQPATIHIEALAGSGDYEYEISGASTVARADFPTSPAFDYQTLASGNHVISVYDKNLPACPPRVFTVNLPVPEVPNFSLSKTDETCFNAEDGTISWTETSNSVSPLTYELRYNDVGNTLVPPANFTENLAIQTFSDLAPGDYIVRAIGTNGCPQDSPVITINDVPEIQITGVGLIPFTCSSGNTPGLAQIQVNTVTGGSGNYLRYEFLDASNTSLQNGSNSVFNVLDTAGGTFTINVYDDKGCMGTTTASIPAMDLLLTPTINLDPADRISCIQSTERITITAHGSITDSSVGPHDYSFTWIGSSPLETNTNGIFANLPEGNHAFSVTNVLTGCSTTVYHTVNAPDTFDIEIDKISDVVCHGTQSGEISFEMFNTAYTGNVDWTVYDALGAVVYSGTDLASTQITGIMLEVGTYRVEMVQQNYPSCTESRNITITGPDAPLTVTGQQMANVQCSNDQGVLFIEPQGGIAPYTITLSSGSFTTTQTDVYASNFNGLSAGTYDVEVVDNAGCSITQNAIETLALPEAIVASLNIDTPLICFGGTNAILSANISSTPTGTVRYYLNRWNTAGTQIDQTSVSQLSNTFYNLTAGYYSITMIDDALCETEVGPIEIVNPNEVVASLVRTSPLSCHTDAELTLTANGGANPGGGYEYSEDGINFTPMNGGNTHTFTVRDGDFRYYVRDVNGCEPILSNQISETELRPLTISIDDSAAVLGCAGDATATLHATADGGMGDYSYELYTDASLSGSVLQSNTTGIFQGLAAYTYYVKVLSGDCVADSGPTVIEDPLPLELTENTTQISCFDAADGRIELNLSGGSGNYQYAISPNLDQFDDESVFENLDVGTYTVIAQDSNGCFASLEIEITQPEELVITGDAQAEICAGDANGLIQVQINGGTAPYRTAINSNNEADFVDDRLQFNDLAGGTYVIFVRDANNCEANIALTVNPGVNLDAEVVPVYSCTGVLPTNRMSVRLLDVSVATEVMYGLDTTDPSEMVLVPDFENLTAGTHFLTIAHSNGCVQSVDFEVDSFEALGLSAENTNINEITLTATGGSPDYSYALNDGPFQAEPVFLIKETATHVLTVRDALGCETQVSIFVEFFDIEFPNFFTPNHDGENDVWKPLHMEPHANIIVKVYDRFGRCVHTMGRDDSGWEGLYQDTKMPTGDYWYVVKLNGEEDDREFVGHFTLYR
ncbi:T9SS type B sorting domain-containing protein [Sediminicola luteus]|uniref:DUF8202 domain-containing protein n=1 Tax=Sediminicola luteus TaxID=319238 RepID=A0A2A4GF05_9FLAO|nr:T9SS type B sorting domain-containing protein [Sediminicola luteus]PCE66594.1 hypothetical protein B7P33_04665 [Sediminicola luteus]